MGSLLAPASGPHVGAILLLALSTFVLVLLLILRGRRGKHADIRALPAFQDLPGEMERAAEMGTPIHIALGSGALNSQDAVTSLASLQTVEALADAAVSYSIPPIITVGDPTLLLLAQDTMRRMYEQQGLVEMYDAGQVRFVAPSSVAYAAGAGNVVAAEDVTASVMAGAFGAEVSLIADAGARRDLPQLAAAVTPRAIAALYAATDRVAMGEELFAAGAQMTRERHYLAGLVAQDILRVFLVLAIIGGTALAFLGS